MQNPIIETINTYKNYAQKRVNALLSDLNREDNPLITQMLRSDLKRWKNVLIDLS